MEGAKVLTHQSPARKAARRIFRIWAAHSSGRFDRSDASWRASLKRLIRLHMKWVTGTEAAGRDNKQFKTALSFAGWDYSHLTGAAAGECWAAWDTDFVELMGKPFAAQLSDMTYVRSPEYGGGRTKPVHALVVPLKARKGKKQWVLVISHDPLDNTQQRAEVWVDVQHGKVQLNDSLELQYPDAEIIFVADVNKNLRQPEESFRVARYIEHPMKKLASWRGHMPQGGGTHGNQVIDMAFADPGVIVDCQLVVDDKSSDHRPFKYRLAGRLRKVLRKIKP